MSQDWSPVSWQQLSAKQLPTYPSREALDEAISVLNTMPALVLHTEIETLKTTLAKVAQGDVFILQAGDCAERFQDCDVETVTKKLLHLDQLADILSKNLSLPVVPIGRIAGQFSKPRSNELDNTVYRGDLINGFELKDRTPDPSRLMKGYEVSKRIYNSMSEFKNIFASHEALNLYYESAMTRQIDNHWYNLSTHFPWLGMRTNISPAHVEYFSGIENPIAVKIGPDMLPSCLIELIGRLNPDNIPGKIMLVHRIGLNKIREKLPDLIETVQSAAKQVVWCVDPMHGNTEFTGTGIKTRHIDKISSELHTAIEIHQKMGSQLSGIHLEITHDSVTECVGGGVGGFDLSQNYQSLLDPRLNYEQSILICEQLKK